MSSDPTPRHNRLALLLVITVVLAAAVAVTYAPSSPWSWGPDAISEDFASPDWKKRWVNVGDGSFTLRDNRLVSTGNRASVLMLKERLPAGCAIQFTGTMLADSPPGDLSVIWTENSPEEAGSKELWKWPGRSWIIQTGAYDNSFASITAQPGGMMAIAPLHLEPGTPHDIRVEITTDTIVLYVDGSEICRHREMTPFTSGYLAIFGYYAGKAFDNLRVQHSRMPDTVPAMAIGNSFFRHELYDLAANEYHRLRMIHDETHPVSIEARYREGLSHFRAGRDEDAFRLWQRITGEPWRSWASYEYIAHAIASNDHASARKDFPRVYQAGNVDVRNALVRSWVAAVNSLTDANQLNDELDGYLQLRRDLFADTTYANEAAAKALRRAGRFEQILDEFDHDPWALQQGLLALGQHETNLERIPFTQARARALLGMGRFEEIWKDYRQVEWAMRESISYSGRFDQIPNPGNPGPGYTELALFGASGIPIDDNNHLAIAGLFKGDFASVASQPLNYYTASAYIATGRGDEILADTSGRFAREQRLVHWHRALDAAIAGDRDALAAELALLPSETFDHHWHRAWFPEVIFRAWLPLLDGDREAAAAAFDDAAKRYHNDFSLRAWHLIGAARGTLSSEEVLNQPAALQAEGILHLGRALRAEIDGADPAPHYQAYLALPAPQRITNRLVIDTFCDRFAAWRSSNNAP